MTAQSLKRNPLFVAYCFIGIAAFVYILIRSLTVSITYDEAWTINDFVPLTFMHIINYTPTDANNHIINTLLIKCLFALGSHNLFIARLPNVCSFVVYLYFGYHFCNKYFSPFIGIVAYLLLILNPFLLDFFSLARGYGIALGMQMASLYYFAKYIREMHPRDALLTFFFGIISVLSNFSVLNYWLAIFAIVVALPVLTGKMAGYGRILLISIVSAAVLLLIIYEPIRKLKENGNLYYGGSNDFYHDTLISITKYSLYSPAVSSTAIFALNVFLIILGFAITISFYFNHTFRSVKTIMFAILIISIGSVIIQHYLLHTLYLIDRTALFFYPLLILVLCLGLNDVPSKVFAAGLASLSIIAFAVNFFFHANFFKTATWYFDAHTLPILDYINNQGKNKGEPVTVDLSWPFQNSFYYYAGTGKYPFVKLIEDRGDKSAFQNTANFYVYLNQSLEKVGYEADEQKVCSFKKDTVLVYPNEGVYLFTNLHN